MADRTSTKGQAISMAVPTRTVATTRTPAHPRWRPWRFMVYLSTSKAYLNFLGIRESSDTTRLRLLHQFRMAPSLLIPATQHNEDIRHNLRTWDPGHRPGMICGDQGQSWDRQTVRQALINPKSTVTLTCHNLTFTTRNISKT